MFSRLCVLDSGAISFIFWVNSWASLYAGAPLQFTTGRIGFSGLCSLIRPLMVGAVGFKFKYFHLEFGGMCVLLLFTTFLTLVWKDFVGSFAELWKWFVCMKSSTLVSYCAVGRITKELPLSARAIMASFSFSLVFMFLMVLISDRVLCVCVGGLQNIHTHLGPSRTRCRSYNIKTKETTSTRLKDFTFILNSPNITI